MASCSVAVVLVLAAVAVVMSINRGLWLALAVMGLFMAARAAFMGRPGILVMARSGVAVVGLLVTSPLAGVVQARLSNNVRAASRGGPTSAR